MEAVDLAKSQAHRTMFPAPLLQRVLRETEGHVDLAHLDAVLAGIADDLRGGVKAHRLGIQEAAAEGVRMIVLQP